MSLNAFKGIPEVAIAISQTTFKTLHRLHLRQIPLEAFGKLPEWSWAGP